MDAELKNRALFCFFSEYKKYFATLSSFPVEALNGEYRSRVPGPFWYRWSFAPSLAFTALRGWVGKAFFDNGRAINLVRRKGKITRVLPMTVREQNSELDGNPVQVVIYPDDAPFPWNRVTDELRRVNETTIVGMTIFHLPVIRHIPFPFILRKSR